MNHSEKVKFIVEDMMTKQVITAYPEMTMAEAKEIMRLKNISGLPVVNKNKELVGIISVADVIQALEENKLEAKVEERMTKKVYTLKPYDSINSALSIFRRHHYGRLPVIDDNNILVGLITPNDIVRRFANYLKLDEISEVNEHTKKVIKKSHTLEFEVKGGDFDTAGKAASGIKKALQELGISSDIIRRAAIAVYEAEMNIVIHADEGKVKAVITPDKFILDVRDKGPGIENIELAMQAGFSTAPDRIREMGFGAGMGLPNIKKSSDLFNIESVVGKGTYVHVEIFF